MATYKQPCIHCRAMVGRDALYCPQCGSRSPFGYHCPACLKPIERGHAICSGCGKSLSATCPYCNKLTFVGNELCGACGQTLMIRCENQRCNELQFFANTKCTVCGKPLKTAAKQIQQIRNGGK